MKPIVGQSIQHKRQTVYSFFLMYSNYFYYYCYCMLPRELKQRDVSTKWIAATAAE